MISEREGEFKMSKPKINLSHIGYKNADIISHLEPSNKELTLILSQYIDDDKKFFSILWGAYDICFDRNDNDYIKQDIYSNESYVRESAEYNYVLNLIIKDYHAYNKNGNNLRQIKVWG